MKAKLLSAQYVEDAESILLLLDGEHGQFRSQIHRDAVAKFGSRTEAEIIKEMEKYAKTLSDIYKDKEIEIEAEGR